MSESDQASRGSHIELEHLKKKYEQFLISSFHFCGDCLFASELQLGALLIQKKSITVEQVVFQSTGDYISSLTLIPLLTPPRHRDQSYQEEPGRQRGSAHGAEVAPAPGCFGLSRAQHLRHSALLLHLIGELQEHH